CLGDMPLVDAAMIDRMIEAFSPGAGSLIVVPVNGGRRGNPVVWARRYFGDLARLDGDFGARHLIVQHADAVTELEVSGPAAFLDIDTPEALADVRQNLGHESDKPDTARRKDPA
ncbi:MAG: NTP transferase domain-containing protein, partial [Rhizobiales bacterium]|nr:NTP transferase domain-containing protein [Hyphomicrobiales bacterium]